MQTVSHFMHAIVFLALLFGCADYAQEIRAERVKDHNQAAGTTVLPASEQLTDKPEFHVATRRGSKVKVTQSADRVIFDCYGDIDTATVTLKKGRWPLDVTIRIHRAMLEGFRVGVGKKLIDDKLITIGHRKPNKYFQCALPASVIYKQQPKTLVIDWVDAYRN